MKGKKQRVVKAGNIKKKVPSDVSPSTSLPPLVEGQLRCFLRVTISRVLWTVHKPPCATLVRLRWWGESSNGTHFLLRDGHQLSQKTIETTARFPIRCGPKQFTSYLTDMGSLVFEVLTKADHLPVARAQVAGISSLSMSHPINGFYTLVSPTSEKLGELQVSLNLEPLTEAYDSSSSGPTTDLSVRGQQATRPLSAGSGKESIGSSNGSTPRGKDYLYFQSGQKDKGEDGSLENQVPITSTSQNVKNTNNLIHEPSGQTSGDILSVLLERGNKLRNAMVASALTCDVDSALALKDTPFPLPKDNSLPPSKPLSSPSGMFLENILHADSSLKHSDAAVVSVSGLDGPTDMDSRAVDLLLGSLNTSPQPLWSGELSSPESLSDHISVCGDSDTNDPQYDQSLLENLFYTTPVSDTKPEDATAVEGQETVFSCKNPPEQLTQSGPQFSKEATSEHQSSAEGIPLGLSAEQLTKLCSFRLVRVTIDSLTIPTGTTPRKASSKGKPPRPLTSKKCTFFVEYVFPIASALGLHDCSKTGHGEVTRAVSSKLIGEVVKFNQLSVFPAHFSKATVEKWWETNLTFKVSSQKNGQKKPVPIGQAVHPLHCLLQSKELRQSVVLPVQNLEGNIKTREVGHLKVSLELTTDSKDCKSKVSWRDSSPSQTAPSPQRETGPKSGNLKLPAYSLEDSRRNVRSPRKPPEEPFPHPSLRHYPQSSQVDEDPEVLLHTVVMVPDGRNFTCGPLQAPNVYLNCKLFWCSETARSVVSWGQANPVFNFVQVTPVALTTKLLERMKNNVMVIEVWQKLGSSGQDRLLGLVKLPLNQFYMSFRDPKITQLLLQAHYPVLGVDSYMPVIDVFSGSCNGNLRVVLAMGRSEQIAALQRTRAEEHESLSHLVRPVHLLDQQARSQTKVFAAHKEIMTEHVFVIRLEKIMGLTPLQSTVWGEADCYIQYSFPCQEGDPAAKVDEDLIESSVNLKPFRSTTTLCVPDPVLGHTETHVLLAPEGVPVQKLLLSSLSGHGLSSGGGIQFEVWCRYYYPNVRDQLVAKGLLSLSKLCAMVTMQSQHPDEAQMFSLPLIPRMESPTGHQLQPSGLLDVCIRYKHRPVRSEALSGRGAASRVVTLLVQVHRASGLQAAARVISNQDERFNYFASVGVNTYVTVQLSFLPENERRCTRIAASTFCPEFNHHMEVSCDLLIQKSTGETYSLAEQLEDASAVFTLWNIDNRKAINISKPKDVILGTVKIPLADLIHKRTGISGWFGVSVPQEAGSSHHRTSSQHHVLECIHCSDAPQVICRGHLSGLSNQLLVEPQQSLVFKVWHKGGTPVPITVWIPVKDLIIACLGLGFHAVLEGSAVQYGRREVVNLKTFDSSGKHKCARQEESESSNGSLDHCGNGFLIFTTFKNLMIFLRSSVLSLLLLSPFFLPVIRRPMSTNRLVCLKSLDKSSHHLLDWKWLTITPVSDLMCSRAGDMSFGCLYLFIAYPPSPMTATLYHDSNTVIKFADDNVLQPSSLKNTRKGLLTAAVKRGGGQDYALGRISPVVTGRLVRVVNIQQIAIRINQAITKNVAFCDTTSRSGGCQSSGLMKTRLVLTRSVFRTWSIGFQCAFKMETLVDILAELVLQVSYSGFVTKPVDFNSVLISGLLARIIFISLWKSIITFSQVNSGVLSVLISQPGSPQRIMCLHLTLSNLSILQPSHCSFPQLHCLAHQLYSSWSSHLEAFNGNMVGYQTFMIIFFTSKWFHTMERSCVSHLRLRFKTASEDAGVARVTLSCLLDIRSWTERHCSRIHGSSMSREGVDISQKAQYRGVFGTIFTMVKTEGARSLYNGLVAGLQRQMSFASVRVGLYDTMKQFYTRGSENAGIGTRLLAGCTTGAMAVAFAQPTDVVKVRFQAQVRLPGTTSVTRYSSTIHAYKTIARDEGVKGLWKGE
ncbi:C2 domain-containing protein 3 Protein hearty [Channa argus]|uniref:C2 domain-containing protein 3 Protein hearty n=1 Tax=Channa argus TaxID=215402 RepID=A0A6G1PT32_CHAAH|nr:C2 domain-containing protein 3 Protein hearty [Channa argus]